MDSPGRYCPTPGTMSSHPPPSGSPQTIPIMHQQTNQNDGQQQHGHLGHQHQGYYGHTNHSHNYPLQQHSAYYQHSPHSSVPPPVSGYYSPLQQPQQQQNNHVPITTASAPPPVAHNPYHPQSQQGAPPDWQQPVQQHYYHPQQQPHLQQQQQQQQQPHPQSVYPQQSHSPYAYIQQTPQQQPPMTQAQHVNVPPPVHDNHMQQQQSQHALMNLSRFVSQSPSASPGSSNHPQLINGNNLNTNPAESQSPTRSITSPSSSCSTNGQMIPVRLQMGKGQARTKASMRKLAMLEQQNSSNSSGQPFLSVSEGPIKKASRAKTPKNKKSLENGESMFADINLSESTVGDNLVIEISPEKKRRGRKPKNSTSPEEHPVEKKRRQSKKSLGLQGGVPMNGDTVPVKAPRKPRKKKEVLPVPFNQTEGITAPFQEISVLHVEQPKIKSPRGRNKKKKSENLILETMPVTNSPEKEYTLQIPEVNDIPTNTVKIVQAMKMPKPAERKGKLANNSSMQERKAVLEEEVAQALLDLQEGKNGPPSPLKIVEAPTTMLEIYENTNEVHGIKVKKSLNVIDNKAITPKVKTPKTSRKRKSAVDTEQLSEPKRKKSGERKERIDSSPVGKRKKSTDLKESPSTARKRKLSEPKEKPLVVKKKATPKANKVRVSRSPKAIANFSQPETTTAIDLQDPEPFSLVDELSKTGKAKKNKKSARLSVDGGATLGANTVSPNTMPAIGITIAPLYSKGPGGATVAKVTITAPAKFKASAQTPVKTLAPNQVNVDTPSPILSQIPARATTPAMPAKNIIPQVKIVALPTPIKTGSVKATTPSPVKASPAKATTTAIPTQGKISSSPSQIKAKEEPSSPVKVTTPSAASKATTLSAVNIKTPTISIAPISPDTTTLPIQSKEVKSKPARKTANSIKAPRVNTKKKLSTTKAKSTTKSLSRTKKIIKDGAPTPAKRKAKGIAKGRAVISLAQVKAATNNSTKPVSSGPAKSTTTNSTKISKISPAATSIPIPAKTATSDITKNILSHDQFSPPVLDKDNETKNAQSLSKRRRSSTSSKYSSATAINATSPVSSTLIPVTCGPPTEPEPLTLNYLSQPDKPFVSLSAVSSITATASKVIKKRNSKSAATTASYNSTDAIISSVISSADNHLSDVKPIDVVAKTAVPKNDAIITKIISDITKNSTESSFRNNFPILQIKKEKIDVPKVRTRRPRRKLSPVIQKPEPYQLNPKRNQHVPTVFVKQSPLGNTSKANMEKEKHVGPSLKVNCGKVKFYRGSDEEDNETEPKLPREKVPVEFDANVPWTCVFCQLGPQVERLGDLFGPYYVKDDENKGKIPGKRETWVHEECAVWAHKVLLIGASLRNLDEAVYFGDREKCNICGLIGATVGCLERCCTKAVHVPCAKNNSWKLDEKTMLSYCPDHI